MSKKFFEIKNQTATSADLYIYGQIGYNNTYWDGEGTNNRAFALVSELKKIDKEGLTLNVHINSPGGSIADGLAIYNTMRTLKAKVVTHNDGLCASMATILFLAGTERKMPKTALLHFHRASTYAWGNANDFAEIIKVLEAFEDAIIAAITERSGLTNDEIRARWMDGGEHYESATDMAELGIVTETTDTEAKIPVKNFSTFKNVVEAYEKAQNPTNIFTEIQTLIQNRFEKKEGKMTQKKVTFLVMALALQAFALPTDEQGNILLTDGQFTEIENAYKAKETAEKALEAAENHAKEAEAKAVAAEKRAAEAEAKLKATPGQSAATGQKAETQPGTPEDLKLDPVNFETI